MTRAEARQKLISFGFEEPTEAQISAYLDSHNADSRANAEELRRLRDIERQFNEQQGAEGANAEQVTRLTRRINQMSAEAVLAEAGLKPEDYANLIDGLICETEKDTIERAKAFADLLSSKLAGQKTSLEEEFQKKLEDNTPNPGGAGGGGNDDKPDDVKNVEGINFGGLAKDATSARDFYK